MEDMTQTTLTDDWEDLTTIIVDERGEVTILDAEGRVE